jgi:hypothetical protein
MRFLLQFYCNLTSANYIRWNNVWLLYLAMFVYLFHSCASSNWLRFITLILWEPKTTILATLPVAESRAGQDPAPARPPAWLFFRVTDERLAAGWFSTFPRKRRTAKIGLRRLQRRRFLPRYLTARTFAWGAKKSEPAAFLTLWTTMCNWQKQRLRGWTSWACKIEPFAFYLLVAMGHVCVTINECL